MAQKIRIRLDLSPEEYQRFYAGAARAIQATSLDGRVVRFPATSVRPWVQHDGIHGFFLLIFDDNFKLLDCQRIDANDI